MRKAESGPGGRPPLENRETLIRPAGRNCGGEAGQAAFEPFITKPEVARRLQKRLRTVDNWMKRGILPYYKIGRSVPFKWGEIETALAARCRVAR